MSNECSYCHGMGVIKMTDPDDAHEYTIICPACDGTGTVDEDE